MQAPHKNVPHQTSFLRVSDSFVWLLQALLDKNLRIFQKSAAVGAVALFRRPIILDATALVTLVTKKIEKKLDVSDRNST